MKRFLEKRGGKKVLIERYLKSVLFTNLITYMLIIYVFRKPEFIFTNKFTIKYIILALIVSYLFPIIAQLVRENLSIEIKVEKNEGKN